MTEIVFQPYVGPTYRTTAVRVLILGESHYGEPHFDPAEATRHVVRMWLDREWPIRYLTVAARLLTGLEAWQIDRCHAFSAVAFYNFIQVMMADISVRPTPAQAAVSCGAFREVLTSLDPTHVLATGQRFLCDNMPRSDEAAPEVLLGGVMLPLQGISDALGCSQGHCYTALKSSIRKSMATARCGISTVKSIDPRVAG